MTPELIDRATVLRLAHAYADAKLIRYGSMSNGPPKADPAAAFAALVTAVDGLIALAAAHEREMCAKVCEDADQEYEDYTCEPLRLNYTCAVAIRARG